MSRVGPAPPGGSAFDWVGASLLRDAMLRTLTAAETVGIRVLLVHAIDGSARRFSERHGFEASPTDPLNLQMLIKDLRASVDAARK